jgi:hypothetical protein
MVGKGSVLSAISGPPLGSLVVDTKYVGRYVPPDA